MVDDLDRKVVEEVGIEGDLYRQSIAVPDGQDDDEKVPRHSEGRVRLDDELVFLQSLIPRGISENACQILF